MVRLTLIVPAVALLTGCTTARTAGVDPLLVRRVTADAAAQVKRCYRTPRVMGDAKRISTRLQVNYAADGSLLGVPTVIGQSGVTPSNQLFADDMAEAAIQSVMRCSPLRLPAELYRIGWNSFELTFSPSLRG
jgi:hypothetical protein